MCAGSIGAVDICVVDTVSDSTESGEAALQRLTAGMTRAKGPLVVAAPSHRWGMLAAAAGGRCAASLQPGGRDRLLSEVVGQ